MLTSAILPVGICACTRFYREEFAGKKLVFSSLGGRELRKPIEFTLVEIVIPEEEHDQALWDNRCTFFVDIHQKGDTPFSLLDVTLTMKERKKGWYPYMSLAEEESDSPWVMRVLFRVWHDRMEPPRHDEILETMWSFIERFTARTGRRKINRWLSALAQPTEAFAA